MHLLTGLLSKLITLAPIINHSCRSRHRYSPQTFILGIVHDIIIIISIVRKHNKTFIIRGKVPGSAATKTNFSHFSFANTSSIFSFFFSVDSLCRLHLLFRMTLCVSGTGNTLSFVVSGGLQNTSLIEIFEIKSKFAKKTCSGMCASRGVGGK